MPVLRAGPSLDVDLACRIKNKHMHGSVEESHPMDFAVGSRTDHLVMRINNFEDFIVGRIRGAFQSKTSGAFGVMLILVPRLYLVGANLAIYSPLS